MSLRTTLSLLLLVGALAAVLLLTNERPDEDTQIQVSVLRGFKIDDATKLKIVRKGVAPITLEAEAFGRFKITEPIVDRASAGALRQIAAAFDSAMMVEAYEAEEVTEERLQQTGLDEPLASLEVEFKNGEVVKLELGGKGALGQDMFLRRGDSIYRSGLGLFSSIQLNVDGLRDKQVFLNTVDSAREVTIDHLAETGQRETLRLVEKRAVGWRMVEPIETRVEGGALQGFLAQLLGLKVDNFVPGRIDFPDREPDILVTIKGGYGDETVKLWRTEEEHLVGEIGLRDVHFASLRRQYVQIFANAAGQLRARWLIPIADLPKELVRVELDPGQGGGKRVVLAREGDRGFKLYEPVQADARSTPVSEMIQALNNCRVVAFVEGEANDPRYGLLQGFFTVTVHGQHTRQGVSIHLGSDGQIGEVEVTYARRADEPGQVVAVPRPVADLLRRPWPEYVADKIIELNVPVQTVAVVRVAGEERRTWKLQEGRWQVDQGPEPGALVSWLGPVVDELVDLRAQRALDAEVMGLGKPDWTLALGRDNYDALAELQLWDRGGAAPMLVQVPRRHPSLLFEINEVTSDAVRRLLWK